jgi:cobyrinic acid a,c-diamide synthase
MDDSPVRAFMIAAPKSGSGKTTVTLALLRTLARRGLRVRPYKVGPDYLDPTYHHLACGEVSYNLDSWMTGEDYIARHFGETAAGYDVAVIEGVMGLFDGRGGSFAGSSAEIAAILGLPVILVVDCSGMSASVAPLVQGFARFDERVDVTGVILNNVAGENHLAYLTAALEKVSCLVVGHVFRDDELRLRHRHLGLVTAASAGLSGEDLDRLSGRVTRHLDVDGLLESARPLGTAAAPSRRPVRRATVAVARDEAFHFYYPANLDHLREQGADILFFSPLRDSSLPPETDLVYLGGGYPEVYAPELSRNTAMRGCLRDYVSAGGALYAECGGLIYLGRSLLSQGERYPLCSVFDLDFRMLPSRKRLGYVEIELTEDTLIGPKSTRARGHEFHYSEIIQDGSARAYRQVYDLLDGEGERIRAEGYVVNRALASYVHLHFGSNRRIAGNLVEQAVGVR